MAFFNKICIAIGAIGGPLTLVFSDIFSKRTFILDTNDSLRKVSGGNHKRVALLIRNSKIDESIDLSSICDEKDGDLIGIGILQEVKINQFSSGGFIDDVLVPIGCTGKKPSPVGNSSHFWYGILDYNNAIVELLSYGIKNGVIVGWDADSESWKESKEEHLEEYDRCYRQKLPQIGEALKAAFKDDKVMGNRITVIRQTDCQDYKFRAAVMNIYQKGPRGWNYWDLKNGTSWGKFNKSLGDRLSNIKVGLGKIGTKGGIIYHGFPRQISLKVKAR